MSEIVADHLKGRERIEIYDPCSGSGSLLITIGRSAAKYIRGADNIRYYAQELKENTYNLTRMNLVMRGILPDNIVTRNGDSLEDDWPFFDENHAYRPLFVDAVTANPPYSQRWQPKGKDTDLRFSGFGLAPKSKADYAFLLHGLYHLKPDGIMTIILPHGVLFRGGEEGEIRRNLIEKNQIDAIIGLPPAIFYGTGIPVVIVVLKKQRDNTDILVVDASRGFVKAGKNNQLRASDIRKIVDTVTARRSEAGFARVVSREEICANGYNLNIPRYVDSAESTPHWDIYASMFGGIPDQELSELAPYWAAFPGLRGALFSPAGAGYSRLAVSDVKAAAEGNADVQTFRAHYAAAWRGFRPWLERELIGNMANLRLSQEENHLSAEVFQRLAGVPLVDKYAAYQLLDDQWRGISADLEILQTEGFAAVKQADPNMIVKQKDGKETETQDGWRGHVLPFELVQSTLLKDETAAAQAQAARLDAIAEEYAEIGDSFSEEDETGDFWDSEKKAFNPAGVKAAAQAVYEDSDSPELSALAGYLKLLDEKGSKTERLRWTAAHREADWAALGGGGLPGKNAVTARMKTLQQAFAFPEESFEAKVLRVSALMDEEKDVRRETRALADGLHEKTKAAIENLSDEQARELLKLKWIEPLAQGLEGLPETSLAALVKAVQALAEKYAVTLVDLESQRQTSAQNLAALMDELTGPDADLRGLDEFRKLLKGD